MKRIKMMVCALAVALVTSCAPMQTYTPPAIPQHVVVASYLGCDIALTFNELTYLGSVALEGEKCPAKGLEVSEMRVRTKLSGTLIGRSTNPLDGFGVLAVVRQPGEALVFEARILGLWVKLYELPWQ